MRLIVTVITYNVVCMSVSLLVTRMCLVRTVELITVPFGMLTRVGQRKCVLGGDPISRHFWAEKDNAYPDLPAIVILSLSRQRQQRCGLWRPILQQLDTFRYFQRVVL